MRRLVFVAATLLLVFAECTGAIAQSSFDLSGGNTSPKLGKSPILSPIGSFTPDASAVTPPHVRAPFSADASALVAGNNHFAFDMYRNLSAGAKAGDNVLVSPFSISAALAMTYAGARGQTAQQMASVLGFTLPGDRLHPAFGELLRDLTAPRDGYQLNIANRLFGRAGYPFESPFLNTTGNDYGAPLEALDFAGNPDGARGQINQWVEDQTNDKIRNLMPDGSVTPDMRLVLANAIYFKGSWKSKFDAEATHDDKFFGSGGRESQVSMMAQQHSFLYTERATFQMLEMPYAGDDLSMVVLLPKERDGLASLEGSLSADGLQESLDALRSTTVNVELPKFKFDSSFELSKALKSLGITDAFDQAQADFSGMVDPSIEQLYIGEAFHKAFVEVNEEGTEAAAATAIGMVTDNAFMFPSLPTAFIADHPFLFALRDVHTGSLLFIGRVVDPGQLSPASAAAAPEPATIALLVIGIAVVSGNRRRGI